MPNPFHDAVGRFTSKGARGLKRSGGGKAPAPKAPKPPKARKGLLTPGTPEHAAAVRDQQLGRQNIGRYEAKLQGGKLLSAREEHLLFSAVSGAALNGQISNRDAGQYLLAYRGTKVRNQRAIAANAKRVAKARKRQG